MLSGFVSFLRKNSDLSFFLVGVMCGLLRVPLPMSMLDLRRMSFLSDSGGSTRMPLEVEVEGCGRDIVAKSGTEVLACGRSESEEC